MRLSPTTWTTVLLVLVAGTTTALAVKGPEQAAEGSRPSAAVPAPARSVHADTRGGEPVLDTLPLSVSVAGNLLVDQTGRRVRLLGANRSGTQYACVEGFGIFDGPVDDAALAAMASWGMTAVRISLNEHCWLGVGGVPPAYGGGTYRDAIVDLVNRLNALRLYVVLDLHWNAPRGQEATGQQPMADRDHAAAFWRSVAGTFRTNRAVVLDLYNEPYPDGNQDSAAAWRCVRDGGSCSGVPFAAAGSQEMLDAVRSTGATNVVMVGGPQYAGSLTSWEVFAPRDPVRQLAASVHVYGPDFAPCAEPSCWESVIGPLAERVPVVMGEIGIAGPSCSSAFVEPLMRWADTRGVSYLAWAWVVSSCTEEPSLITSYAGDPTAYGAGVRDHLLRLAAERAAGAERCPGTPGDAEPADSTPG